MGREYRRAVELNPNYATAHERYAEYLSSMGRHEESLAEITQAQQLDPLSIRTRWIVGAVLYRARQYDRAIEQFRKILKIDPGDGYSYLYIGLANVEKGEHEQGIAALRKAVELTGQKELIGLVGYAHGVAGKRGEALKILGELMELSKRKDVVIDPSLIASVHIGLGERDQAFKWLNKAVGYGLRT